MTKPATLTISYIIYPPNYEPGNGYHMADTVKKARRIALRLGVGAVIHRCTVRQRRLPTNAFRLTAPRVRCASSTQFDFYAEVVPPRQVRAAAELEMGAQ